jgi:C1A family cysteine protease
MDYPKAVADYFTQYHHYGLVRDERETAFKAANPFALPESDFPAIDYASLPERMGTSDWLVTEDQLQIGSCQGVMLSSVAEMAIKAATGQIIQLSRMWAYLQSQKVDGIRGDNGSTLSGGSEAGQTVGLCLESLFPYPGRYSTAIPAECAADAATRKLRMSQNLPDYEAVMKWLRHGVGGVGIGIGWNRYCEPDVNGCVLKYVSGGGGHAIALADWNGKFKDEYKRPFIELKNSWSRRWGVNGSAFIHPKVIDYWCRNETVMGYSDMQGDGVYPREVLTWRV